jgi:hypothetical protein
MLNWPADDCSEIRLVVDFHHHHSTSTEMNEVLTLLADPRDASVLENG